MNENSLHITEEEKSLFNQVDYPYTKSKDDVWEVLSDKINEKPDSKIILKSSKKWILILLAFVLIALLVGVRFYKKTIVSVKGEFANHILPDGSQINLNSESYISYHPYWWKINRELNFEGEAFFEVEKGSKFSVISSRGKTEVLGTSFNILARDESYKVICATGKVKVTDINTKQQVILTPKMMAEIKDDILVNTNVDVSRVKGWKNKMFVFNSESLLEVFKSIERHYDIKINVEQSNVLDLNYTGNFQKFKAAEESINLICQSFNLTFIKVNEKSFKVVKK